MYVGLVCIYIATLESIEEKLETSFDFCDQVSRQHWSVADRLNVCFRDSWTIGIRFCNGLEGFPGRTFGSVKIWIDCRRLVQTINGATWQPGFKAFPFIVVVHRRRSEGRCEVWFEGGLWVSRSVVICIQIGTLGVCLMRVDRSFS